MDERFVRRLIEPYVHSNKVKYDDFDNAFSMLSNKEKYAVVDLLNSWNIDLVDDDFISDNCQRTMIKTPNKQCEEDNTNSIATHITEFQCEVVPWNTRISLTNEQLCLMHQNGDSTALSKILINNKRFVYKIALRYDKIYNHKLDLEDLVQAGYIGIIKATDRFDLGHENKFITYADWWIKQSILRVIADEGFTIRIPVHMFDRVLSINKIERDNLGFGLEELIDIATSQLNLNRQEILYSLEVRDQIMHPASLNMSVSDESEEELIDFIPNEQDSLDDVIIDQLYKDEVREITKMVLSDKEYYILNRMYGLEDNITRTLEDVGRDLGVTRERVRQIKKKALSKLVKHFKIKKYS